MFVGPSMTWVAVTIAVTKGSLKHQVCYVPAGHIWPTARAITKGAERKNGDKKGAAGAGAEKEAGNRGLG